MESLKARADAAFKAGASADAAALYGEALAAGGSSDKRHILHANRSAALLKLGDAAGAAADALQCVRLDASYTKGFFRLGAALNRAGWSALALRAFTVGQDAAKTPAAAAEMAAGAAEVRPLPRCALAIRRGCACGCARRCAVVSSGFLVVLRCADPAAALRRRLARCWLLAAATATRCLGWPA